MPYKFYCMGCGRELEQDGVLFDMQHLLTQDSEKNFQILKFRLTLQELRQLLEKGTPGEKSYREIKLTLSEVMAFIANERNLNDREIASLSKEEIVGYLEAVRKPEQEQAPAAASGDLSEFDDSVPQENAPEEENTKKEYKPPASIQAIEAKDTANMDRAFTRAVLEEDLERLRSAFCQDNTLCLWLRLTTEFDNDGQKVEVGYDAHIPVGNVNLSVNARVCPGCGRRITRYAGTAEHQAVVFIGYSKSGKTSTILSLAHYAESGMRLNLGGIWGDCPTIPMVADSKLVDADQRLRNDLESYKRGLAPGKTGDQARDDAYCATFRIKNGADNRYRLLTLTDLPGELFKKDGSIKITEVHAKFPVAMTADVYVACFDTAAVDPNDGNAVSWVNNVCEWTEACQKKRAEQKNAETYVPTMLLFTKCKDLENPGKKATRRPELDPIRQTYMLQDERQCIEENSLYQFVQKQFNQSGRLSNGYHAMMRCSPFGFPAPSQDDLNRMKDTADTWEEQPPKPKNVDLFMRWLLSVSGCIPTEGEYRRNGAATSRELKNFCISRAQLRTENPLPNSDLDEAMARCVLFENPGYFDQELLKKYDTPWQLWFVQRMSEWKPNSNAR